MLSSTWQHTYIIPLIVFVRMLRDTTSKSAQRGDARDVSPLVKCPKNNIKCYAIARCCFACCAETGPLSALFR